MSAPVSIPTRYLAEWYLPVLSSPVVDDVVARLDEAAAGMCAEGTPVSLLMTLAVPSDEVLFGVFVAESRELVEKACARAGSVPERLIADVDVRIAQRS